MTEKNLNHEALNTYLCPLGNPADEDDLPGCGQQYEAETEPDGWVECPHCGLMLDTAIHKPVEQEPA